MAQITPNEILEISEPIEAIYQRTVDELLINIARHFEISGWERTRYWEIKKLSEMGALTKESAAIIAKNTKMLPEEIEKAFLQVSEKACMDIDPQLRAAAEKGILQDPRTSPSTSVLMRQQVQAYVDQAVDKANLVNTTMLESTRDVYLQGVRTAVNAATRAEIRETLESGALSVVTGAETRTMAIRKAMNAVCNMGITGFYDRAGRKWSADAYVSMVIRTTAHNTAITSIRTRQQEFGGGDIFQVSSHPAARPLCYPYQGKFFSWSSEGIFTDGAGHKHEYHNIEDSSYGEPAGLFGINCGHHPIPMIEGFSYPQDGPEMTEEENAKAYEESQRQRQYERNIREAKRDVEIAKATGDTEAIKAAQQKVAQEQANMRAFIKETGRPRRYDREAIGGEKIPEGYKGFRAQSGSDIPTGGKQKTQKVKLSDVITKSMGADAKDFMDVVNKAANSVKALYTQFSDRLAVCTKSKSRGYYSNIEKKINWNFATYGHKWRTFAHEYGHFADTEIPTIYYTTKEFDAVNQLIGRRMKAPVASSSDEFLLAMRADKAYNMKYKTDPAFRKKVQKDLIDDNYELSVGVQDMYDGFFGTQSSKDYDFMLPIGHGNRYYNRFYNNWIKSTWSDKTDDMKQLYNDLGLDVKTKKAVKEIARDYDTASELWANINSAASVDPKALAFLEKYAPNSVKAYKEIIGRYAKDVI